MSDSKPEITDDISYARWILSFCEYCKPDGTGEGCCRDRCFMATRIIDMVNTFNALREAFPEVREWLDKHLAP